jgi:pyruvate dehydrogenase E2 component (dihydrolipoamide acetyltransferase)
MTVEFRLPDVGEGVAEGELVQWLVEPGDRVSEDQPVAEVETDKAVVEVPAPLNGTVGELRAEPGDVVPVGDVLLTFEEDDASAVGSAEAVEDDAESGGEGEATSGDAGAVGGDGATADADGEVPEADTAPPEGRVFAPPSVRRLARELGVELGTVEGTGPSGRITESDVRAAAENGDGGLAEAGAAVETDETTAATGDVAQTTVVESQSTSSAPAPEAADSDRTLAVPATRKLAAELGVDLDAVAESDTRDGEAVVSAAAVREYAERQQAADSTADRTGESHAEATGPATVDREERVERQPYRGIRKTIGDAMERSKYTAPHVTHHDRVDATALVETRETLVPLAEERGVKLTYLPIVMKAVVAALKKYPVLNSSLDEEEGEVLHKHYYNLGVATATEEGLMVPVVDAVDRKGLLEIATETRELVSKARDRSIAREEMQGGTFTITNFGAIGGEYATPIINYPETAILGLGALEQRPVVEGGSLSDPGEIVPRPVLPLSLSIDHRVIDGGEAAAFVNTLKEYLQEPRRLLLE